ncbi:bifunctional alpha,alpha-trehalose-phosphate synthase (UDP-forming)/trehalose-phosphatase [Arcticibacter eurypsychrophilus]|uniref:bifunctional alpha,alpha-trehalose-phosphate synthase (UDP-forming)/trehalose-phosphatase n=1 Tax=Arcticibacter eurypsychrophilus TaxID=1434752 RepID=UPI0009F4A5A9|nr:bifunctional alpha,alpha-trehalose-phosphate synthase (UDP-forming)/trehalose-phosphatase [Arcticibacter eurypsychrophilus]
MKTIIVSNRLPVKITENGDQLAFKQSEGGLATGLGSIYRQGDNMWLGWPGLEVTSTEKQDEIKDKLKDLSLFPVFLTQDEINLYYEGFSNETLWPIFHYHPTYAHYEQSYWDSYLAVNHKFKEAIFKVAEAGDIIWIHDYQLLLLAGLIRAEKPDITIGFFLHIPFPSYELFRLIPWRAELLENMLGADLIGFHTFDDARHFISSTTRILPVHATANQINYNDRQIVVEAFPMGIDAEKFETLTVNPVVLNNVALLKESFQDFKMILSIDRLDYSKGILQRLQAFDILLQKNPEYIDHVVMYMIVVPSRDTVPQYKELRDEIDKLVGNINARYRTLNWIPVHYYYRSFEIEMLSALYHVAEVCLVTPMRDGMNLVSKEYVASRTANTGVLILSEMAGAAKELIDAVIVNPNNVGELYRSMIEALSMPIEEQNRRMIPMREVVAKFNVRHWVKIYMNQLKEVKELQASMQAKHVGPLTLTYLEDEYKKASQRLIFLDYDGTLVGFKTNINQAFPDDDLYEILNELIADPLNHVAIVSGRNHDTLEDWFGHMQIDIIAEHGAWQKYANEDWTKLPGLNDQWKQDLMPVLEMYVDRTPGSFIEEKSFSLVWHYRKVEEGLGELRANELMNNLRFLTDDKNLQMMAGNKVIEIKNYEVNKGKVISWLDKYKYDYILALGDDQTDEDMFKVLPAEAYTIKIGSNISAARFYLQDYKEVRKFLRTLAAKS